MNLLDLMVKIGVDDQATDKLGFFSKKAKDGFDKLKVAVVAATAAAGAATIKFATDSIQTGMKFDTAMSQVAATMGTTVDQIQVLRDFAQEMGATTAFSATQAAEALNYMALAGYDAETSMNMLPTVLNLAAAGSIDLAEASDMVTDAQSALGLNIEQTTAMVDQMAAASSKTNTSVQQLGQAFLTVGGTAKNLKGGTVELAASLGILADNGIKGSEGGTALRNVLLALSGDKFQDTFGALGVAAYDAEGNMRSLKDILADMNNVMDGMTVEEKTKLISEAFNKVDLKSVNALLATDAERWDAVTEAIDGSAGAAEKMANTQLDNLQGDITLLQSAYEGLQISLSDKLAPALRVFAQAGGSIISDLTTALKDGTINSIGDLIRYVRENVPAMMDAAGEFFRSILDGLAEQAPDIIAELINLAIDLVDYLVQHAPDMLVAALEFIGKIAEGILQKAPEVLQNINELIMNALTGVLQFVVPFFKAGAELVGSIASAIGDGMRRVLEVTTNGIMDALNGVASFVGSFLVAGYNLISSVIGGIASAIGGVASTVAGGISDAVAAVGSFVGEMWSAGWNVVQGIIDGIWANIGNVASTILGGFRGAVDTVKSFLGIASPSKLFAEIGKNTMLGMADGIEANMGKARNAMLDAADEIYGAAEGSAQVGASWGIPGVAGGVSITIGEMNVTARDAEDFMQQLTAFAARTRAQYV